MNPAPGALSAITLRRAEALRRPVPADVLKAMNVEPSAASPNWQEAFGPEAEVNFHAWSVAKYVGQVAAAGKAVYPLPLYANAALRDPIKPGAPGSYESGGPTDNVIPIWKALRPRSTWSAPMTTTPTPPPTRRCSTSIVAMTTRCSCPKPAAVYGFSFRSWPSGHRLCALRHRLHQNPRHSGCRQAEGRTSYPLGAHRDQGVRCPFAPTYRLLGPMAREVARLNFEGKLQAVAEERGKVAQTLRFGAWDATVLYGVWARNGRPAGNPQPWERPWLPSSKTISSWWLDSTAASISVPPRRISAASLCASKRNLRERRLQVPSRLERRPDGWGLDFSSEPLVLRVSVATY